MENDEAPVRTARPIVVPSLREVCTNVLTRYHQYLGDVGFIDAESLRTIAWHCNAEELARIEDETLAGSDRNLEWYTWHLWKRLLTTDLGACRSEVPPLESPQPVDYAPPRGIEAEPGDYRALYAQQKMELAERSAAARERIAAAYQQAQELKDARKAKMIDKLAPTKRARCTTGAGGRGGIGQSTLSAFLHKPRPDSRSTMLAKPSNQLKLLKDLGLVKPPSAAKPSSTVRIIKSSPVPSAATGHSSSLAGAALLAKATGGQLGRTSVGVAGGSRALGGHVEAQQPHAVARAAAVAAAAAARASAAAPAALAAGSKRPAAAPGMQQGPPAKSARQSLADSGPAGSGRNGSGNGSGGSTHSRPDPRVMFPRQAPSGSPLAGGSKFSVPTARPTTFMQPAGLHSQMMTGGGGGGGGEATGTSPAPGGVKGNKKGVPVSGLRLTDDL